ncbi:hypothetical protein [Novosphingobium sp.]|uniref:hypothetical protein n=1 Tax=Novosphingobium sp. TaxID=1874826 RepID=UPI0025E84B92|nr:hypothetical protein [Novosphingobium sp.]MCC6925782.1 hypothetical protein [Novosphingobium sp.]
MLKPLFPLALIAALGGCVTTSRAQDDGSIAARLGQQVDLGGPKVTPIKVLEDSRCPQEVDCVWAGRVRLEVRIETGAGASVRELASDSPLPVADGTLELVRTDPPRSNQGTIAQQDYRFALRFRGGL